MLDFERYLMRHGEGWLLDIIERLERYEGRRADAHLTLEQRWNKLMAQDAMRKTLAA